LEDLKEFARLNEYTIETSVSNENPITREELKTFIDSLDLPFEERDYQFNAIFACLSEKRKIILSPTASGKSLNCYVLCRYHNAHNRKVLMVVPTINLVKQMSTDFLEYNNNNNVSVQKITAGATKEITHDITISTWQSLTDMPVEWFNQFGAIIGDECHKYTAKCTSELMQKCTRVEYRNGFTGSLSEKKISNMVLTGLFGPIERVANTRELQEAGHMTPHVIKAIVLKYNDEKRREFNAAMKQKISESKSKITGAVKYKMEVDWVYEQDIRNEFIAKLAGKCKGNTIVMVRFKEPGYTLYEKVRDINPDRKVYFVNGDVPGEDREYIRKIVDSSEDNIIVASTGVFSTGVNIKSIFHIIHAAANKAEDEILQIIGRGLRLFNGKEMCNVYDIVDDLRSSSYDNYLIKHFLDRIDIYDENNFSYKIYKHVL